MLDWETFLTALYVAVDDLLTDLGPPGRHPGPAAALEASEVVTLALFAQWGRFPSGAAFSRFAAARLRPCFPGLPSPSRLNRLVRRHRPAVEAVALALGRQAAAADPSDAVVDCTGVATRNHKRRGRGWLAGLTDRGRCSRLEWFHGVYLLLCCGPTGAVTGFGCGPASANDRVLAEAFFAARAAADPRLPTVGVPTSDYYVADMGFAGRECEARWAAAYGARVVCPPQTGSARAWPKPLKTWLASIRQVVETVTDRLLSTFRLDRERPHELGGLLTRLAAAVGLHNFCILLNRTLGRPDLATADLVSW
jgi:hypothetical protein